MEAAVKKEKHHALTPVAVSPKKPPWSSRVHTRTVVVESVREESNSRSDFRKGCYVCPSLGLKNFVKKMLFWCGKLLSNFCGVVWT